MAEYPSLPRPVALEITSISPTMVSVSHSLKRQRRSRGGQRWGFELTYDLRTRDEMLALWAFVVAQRGQFQSFTFVAPGHEEAAGSMTATPTVNGNFTSGTSIVVENMGGFQQGVLKAGDFIKFANHNKVYMVKQDLTSDALGIGVMVITPPLHESVTNGTEIIYDNVEFTCTLNEDMTTLSVKPPLLYDFQIGLIEV